MMKNSRISGLYRLVVIFFAFISMLSATVGAAVSEIAETDRATFLCNLSLTLLSSEPEKDKIDCFDVNAEGLIALGTTGGEGAKVLVYDEDGVFQYGYSFRAGQYFDIAWEGENIAIYFARSSMVACFDRHGNNTALRSVEPNSQSDEFWNTRFTAKKQCVLKKSISGNGYVWLKRCI